MMKYMLWAIVLLLSVPVVGETCRAQIGSPTSISYPLPEQGPSQEYFESFFSNCFFFSGPQQVGRLLSVVADRPANTLTINFIPMKEGAGVCVFPPMGLAHQTVFWPPYEYEYTNPSLPTFQMPLLETNLSQIPTLNFPELFSQARAYQDQGFSLFAQREKIFKIIWRVFFIVIGVGVVLWKVWAPVRTWIKVRRELRYEHKLDRALLHAVQRKEVAWGLLLQRLLVFVRKEYPGTTACTAKDVYVCLKTRNIPELADVALSIEKYAYLPENSLEQFQTTVSMWRRRGRNTHVHQ